MERSSSGDRRLLTQAAEVLSDRVGIAGRNILRSGGADRAALVIQLAAQDQLGLFGIGQNLLLKRREALGISSEATGVKVLQLAEEIAHLFGGRRIGAHGLGEPVEFADGLVVLALSGAGIGRASTAIHGIPTATACGADGSGAPC